MHVEVTFQNLLYILSLIRVWEVKKSHRPKVLVNCLSTVACQMIWETNRNSWSQLFSSKNKSVVFTYCSQMNKHSLKLNSLPGDLIDTSMIYHCHFKQSSLQFPNLAYSSEIPIVFFLFLFNENVAYAIKQFNL